MNDQELHKKLIELLSLPGETEIVIDNLITRRIRIDISTFPFISSTITKAKDTNDDTGNYSPTGVYKATISLLCCKTSFRKIIFS